MWQTEDGRTSRDMPRQKWNNFLSIKVPINPVRTSSQLFLNCNPFPCITFVLWIVLFKELCFRATTIAELYLNHRNCFLLLHLTVWQRKKTFLTQKKFLLNVLVHYVTDSEHNVFIIKMHLYGTSCNMVFGSKWVSASVGRQYNCLYFSKFK